MQNTRVFPGITWAIGKDLVGPGLGNLDNNDQAQVFISHFMGRSAWDWVDRQK